MAFEPKDIKEKNNKTSNSWGQPDITLEEPIKEKSEKETPQKSKSQDSNFNKIAPSQPEQKVKPNSNNFNVQLQPNDVTPKMSPSLKETNTSSKTEKDNKKEKEEDKLEEKVAGEKTTDFATPPKDDDKEKNKFEEKKDEKANQNKENGIDETETKEQKEKKEEPEQIKLVQRHKEEKEDLVQTKLLQKQKEAGDSNQLGLIQKQDDKEEKIHTKADSESANAGVKIESSLNSTKGQGQPLDQETQEKMETSIGADFGNVRIHTNSTAVQMNKDLNSKAFAHGSDIYFNQGNYDTKSTEGKGLLAHELTHTVQQAASPKHVQQQPKEDKTNNNGTAQNSHPIEIQKQGNGDQPDDKKGNNNKPVKVNTTKTVSGKPKKYNKEEAKGKGGKGKIPKVEPSKEKDKEKPKDDNPKEPNYDDKLKQIYELNPDQEPKPSTVNDEKNPNKKLGDSENVTPKQDKEPIIKLTDKPSEEFLAFKSKVLLHRQEMINNSENVKEKLDAHHLEQKTTIILGFSSQEANLKQGHAGRIEKVTKAITTEKLRIGKVREAKLIEIDQAKESEVVALGKERDKQKESLRNKALEKSNDARKAGDATIDEINKAAETESLEMIFIAIKKGEEYKTYNRANRIKAMAKEMAGDRNKEIQDIINQLKDVRKPLDDLADQIIENGEKGAEKFDEAYTEGVKEIEKQHAKIKGIINDTADASIKQLDENGKLFIELLDAKTAGEEKKMKQLLEMLIKELDSQLLKIKERISDQTTEGLGKIDAFLVDVTNQNSTSKGEEASKAFGAADAELAKMVEAFNQEVKAMGEGTCQSMDSTNNGVLSDVSSKSSAGGSGIDGSVNTIIDIITQTGNRTVEQINKVEEDGKADIAKVTKSFTEKSVEAIAKQDEGWTKTINDTKAKVDKDVAPVIEKIKSKSNGLEAEIDKEAIRIENESWWERALNFIGGIFMGFFLAIYDFFAFIFSSLLMAVLAIVIIIVVIILVVKFAIVGVILLVVGIVVAIGFIIYYAYQAITRDDLSDYERGKFVGRAVFEVVLTFIPARHLKLFKVFRILKNVKGLKNADPIRISKLIKALGGVGEAEKLLKLTKDVALAEKLWKQIGDVSKIEKFFLAFKNVDEAIAAMDKLKDASRIELIMTKIGGENLAKLFQNYKFKKASLEQIDELFKSSKVASGDDIIKLFDAQKIASIEQINSILASSKVTDTGKVLLALDKTKFTGETLLRGLNSPLITSIDDLISVGRIIKNKSAFSGKDLVDLLHHSTVKNLDDLKTLLRFPNINGGSKQIMDALATGKINDIKDLNALLGSGKVDSLSDLINVLKSDVIPDIGKLKVVMASDDLKNIKQFQKLLDKEVLKTADELAEVLKEGKLKELLQAIDAAVHIPGIKGGKFAAWFDSLSSSELASLMTNAANKEAIANRIRHPGGWHEWLMVSKAPHVKTWGGVKIQDIWKLRTLTKDIKLTKKFPPPRDHGSGTMHIELEKLISSSSSLDDFATKLSAWAETALVGGKSALPMGLRR